LARRIVTDFHSAEAAGKAAEDWARQFQKGGVPDEVEEVEVEAAGSVKLDKLLVKAGLADSGTDAVRKLKQKSVKVNSEVVSDPTTSIPASGQVTVQLGRKIKKVSFVAPRA
jgi:tyrosyl-tRNA synthetase